MAMVQTMGRSGQALLLAAFFFLVLFLILAATDAGMITAGKCPPKFPKWFGCVLANHETLSESLITAGGALFAAWFAWHAVMDQIESDKELARNAHRPIVHGGPGYRAVSQNGNYTGIIFSAQNTGNTAAFTKRIYWGACKQSEWPTVSKNWTANAKQREWDEVLPPQMKPSERYPVSFTETPIPDDGENYVCYGQIIYVDVFGKEQTTSWRHSVVRQGMIW
jgi:hypothetical protein